MTKPERRVKRKVKRKMRPGCLFSLVSFLLVVLSGVVLLLTPVFNVDLIEVKGNQRIGREVIVKLSEIEQGKNIFRVSSSRAKKNISAIPYVESVKIVKKYPDKVRIEVKEGKVDCYIASGEKLVGINAERKTLCYIDKGSASMNIPIVKGFTAENVSIGKQLNVKEQEKFDLYIKFLKIMKKVDLGDNLTYFDITDEDNISFMYEDKLLVEFGDKTHYENKFSNLASFVATLKESSGGEMPTGIINMVSDNYTFRSVVPKKSE